MSYQVGIDLGTTYSAAALCRAGEPHPEVVPLDGRSASIASVIFLADDGSLITGEAAQRRALTDPARIVREFKRRIGDTTPVHVSGQAVPAETVAARFIASILTQIADREGGPADAVALTHPAEWGPHKRDSLAAALTAEGLGPVEFLSEPHAAAIAYAHTQRLDPGSVVAVYDLGGGTFDAAVIRTHTHGHYEVLGRPDGIEHLGGVDFDQAVFDHVVAAVGSAWADLDATNPSVQSAVIALRRECTAAKEALSADTEVTIPVMLPTLHTQVRLARAEFEDMIRPALAETIEALRRTIATTGVTPDQLTALLLVGGSSRIPLVTQLLSAELDRPIAVDADPKTVIATGAALHARGTEISTAPNAPETGAVTDVPPARPPREMALVISRDEEAGALRVRSRRIGLAVAASVVAALALTGTDPTGTLPLGSAVGGTALASAGEPAATPDGRVDPWTGEARRSRRRPDRCGRRPASPLPHRPRASPTPAPRARRRPLPLSRKRTRSTSSQATSRRRRRHPCRAPMAIRTARSRTAMGPPAGAKPPLRAASPAGTRPPRTTSPPHLTPPAHPTQPRHLTPPPRTRPPPVARPPPSRLPLRHPQPNRPVAPGWVPARGRPRRYREHVIDSGAGRESTPPARPRFEFRERPSEVPVRRPRLVAVSFALWLAAVVAGLTAAILTLVDLEALRARLLTIVQRDFPAETPATQDRAVMAALAILTGVGLLIVLLELTFAGAMRSGRRTRGVLVLLAVLGGLYTAFMLEAAPLPTAVGLVLSATLALVAAVVMYVPGAGPWFTPRRR